MINLLIVNLTTKTATVDGQTAWTPPPFVFGESMLFALRLQQNVEGIAQAFYPTVNAMRAAVGNVDARPASGGFSMLIGTTPSTSSNTTGRLSYSAAASDLQTAINAFAGVVSTYGAVRVEYSNGSFFMVFGSGLVQVPLMLVNNKLWPVSFGIVTANQVDGIWVHQLRLIQAPVAFSDAGSPVVPPGPSMSEVQAGGTADGTSWNEIQALYLPPSFAGAYAIKMGTARTELLSISDGPTQIQAALVAAFGNGFNVTNPLANTANIEFTGAFAGEMQALLTIEVFNAPPGDLTFELKFDRAELAALLRVSPSVTLPFEVHLDITDEDAVVRDKLAFSVPVTISRTGILAELGSLPNINWLQPPSPKDYIPFNSSQVITGQQYFPAVIGDAEATSFAIAHGLATEAVYVFVRENKSNGKQLVDGVDFSVVINTANQVTITALTGAPALNAWAAMVMSAQTVAAFASGLTLTIAQVTGLSAILDSMGNSIASLLTLLPASASAANTSVIATHRHNNGWFVISENYLHRDLKD